MKIVLVVTTNRFKQKKKRIYSLKNSRHNTTIATLINFTFVFFITFFLHLISL